MTQMYSLQKNFSACAAAFGAAALVGVAFDAHAQSLQPGQCYPRATFNETLAAEGMRTLVVGNRFGIANAPESNIGVRGVNFINGVAANLENGQGYSFEGDKPRGIPATRICISAVLESTTLYNINNTAIPRAAYLGGAFDKVVETAAQRGDRPMVIANTVFREGERKRNGLPFVLFGNAARKGGAITSISADGVPALLGVLSELEYTEFAAAYLDTREKQVASLGLQR